MSEKPLVLLTHELPSDWIGSQLDGCQVVIGNSELRGIDDLLLPHLEKASGILCLLDDPIPQEIINQAKMLKVISNYAVGVDNIDVEVCTNLGIPVGHTPGVLTDGTADLTLALLLSVCRKITQASVDAMEGRWASWEPTGWLGVDLRGATIGIIGMGKIGSAVANRLSTFGAKLIFSNRTPLPDLAQELAAKQVDLDELLRTSDIVCLHVPLNEDTFKMIDSEALLKMKEIDDRPKFLIYTGYDDASVLERRIDEEVSGIIHKPCRIEELSRRIRETLDQS